MDTATQERLAALTLALCAVPSPFGEEAALGDWLQAYLARFEVHRVGASLVVRTPPRGRPVVGLFGHTDTVPAHPESGPSRREGDRIVGLGASDMKGGLAVMLTLIEELNTEDIKYDLVFVFYEKEEGPFTDSGLIPLFDALPWLRDIDFAFCLEPTDNTLQVGAVGSLHAEIVFHGVAAHSARPWQGENAIHKAGPLLLALLNRPHREVEVKGFRFREALSVTLASGGRARTIIPDRMALHVNYRFAPGRSMDEVEAELRALVGEAATLEISERCPAGDVVTDHPIARRFLALCPVPVEPKQAWTDVARLGLYGVAAVNFGPGLTAQAHKRDEYAEVPMLARCYALFRRFLTDGADDAC